MYPEAWPAPGHQILKKGRCLSYQTTATYKTLTIIIPEKGEENHGLS